MFYKNSNDLVKQASVKSGHVQNSYATQQRLIQEVPNEDVKQMADGGCGQGCEGCEGCKGCGNDSASLSIGAQFQKAVNNIISSFSLSSGSASVIEGLNKDTSAGGQPPGSAMSGPATTESGALGEGGDQSIILQSIADQSAAYDDQEERLRIKIRSVKNILAQDDSSRGKWVQVTDAEGISKYGYLTRDRIFQVWLAPLNPSNNPQNWFQTSPVNKNGGVLGCPRTTDDNITKFEIGVKWDKIKPFEMVYSKNDTSNKTPLFMMTQQNVRDAKRTPGQSGLFSCDNERTNVFVKERPFADFDTSQKTNRQGCYIINDNVKDSTFRERGFIFQEDLANATISQCKRRAEDLGSSYFLISPPDNGQPDNRGGCWIYTGADEPKLSDLLTYDGSGKKCYNHGQVDGDEDGFMKSYGPTVLPRLYGKNNTNNVSSGRSVALYSLKVGGPTGVDATDRNGRGLVGRIAYIDHNGERHDYPESALSYVGRSDSTKTKYVNIGPYDTRSAESSYSLKEITPGGFIDAVNLLYKASRDGWSPQKFHELCDNKGATYTRAIINDGRVLGAYTSVSWTSNAGYVNDTTAFLYDGTRKYTAEKGYWGAGVYATYMNQSYFPTFGGGHDFYISGRTLSTNAYSFVAGNELLAPFTRKIQMANMYGPAVGRQIPTEITFLNDGRHVYICEDSGFTKMVSSDGQEKNYRGSPSQFNPSSWNSYNSTGYRGAYLLNRLNEFKEFPRQGWGGSQQYTLQDIEVYSVDSNSFPKTNPPDYIRRVRTMPVGQSITASIEKCQAMCDSDEKCGGFVYAASGGASDGKCELKDRTKMYPVGLRVVDHTKKLMLKVPSINGTIEDPECAGSGKGEYKMIDSTHYQYYPDGGAMSSTTKCNITGMVPKDGNLEMPDVTPAINAVKNKTNDTNQRISEYGKQLAVSKSEGFRSSFREGLETDANVKAGTYGDTMAGVSDTLKKIGNAQYQRERLDAIKDETNKRLISESYKFILWSILAILVVMALLKIKEMFGQDDVDEGDADEGSSSGILGFITSLFGIKSALKMDDIADRTEDVKSALANAGTTMIQTGENLASGITDGANNLVNSVNDAAANVVDGARNMADQVSEKAAEAVNSIGAPAGTENNPTTTGGKRRGKSPRIK
jgi:hypothetical protein